MTDLTFSVEVSLNKEPSFLEKWYEGFVTHEGVNHYFWLVDPERSNYYPEVRWFHQDNPVEVRSMASAIIESFLKTKHDRESKTSTLPTEGGTKFQQY
jgi:hypothetical protein